MRPLSHTAISTYLECSLKYKFNYIDKLPKIPRPYFSFGKSVHQALEYLYRVKIPPPPTLEEVLQYYRENWISEGYASGEEETRYFQEGKRILTEFYQRHIDDNFRPPLFAEYLFNLELSGIKLTGYIDRIDKLSDGSLAIIDYKTGSAFDLKRVENDPQLTLYQMAVTANIGLPVSQLSLYHLPSLTDFRVGPRHPDQIANLQATIRQVYQGIQQERFAPSPGNHCQWCDFQKVCPIFAYQYASPQERSDGQLTDTRIKEIVDNYGKTYSRIKELKKELENLRETILKYVQKKNFWRLSGKVYELKISSRGNWAVPAKSKSEKERITEIIKDILVAANEYEKILTPDFWVLSKKILDNELSPETIQKLKKVMEWQEIYTLRASERSKEDEETEEENTEENK